ncbi:hypothetical protein, partial [Peijinzhouia sedimentorum]
KCLIFITYTENQTYEKQKSLDKKKLPRARPAPARLFVLPPTNSHSSLVFFSLSSSYFGLGDFPVKKYEE